MTLISSVYGCQPSRIFPDHPEFLAAVWKKETDLSGQYNVGKISHCCLL